MDASSFDPAPDPDWPLHCADMWRAHVLSATGFDICTITGPSPRSWRDAAAAARRLGVRTFAEAVTRVHGPALASPRLARRGDVVRRGWALGICRGEQAEFYGGVMIAMRDIDAAWPISARNRR